MYHGCSWTLSAGTVIGYPVLQRPPSCPPVILANAHQLSDEFSKHGRLTALKSSYPQLVIGLQTTAVPIWQTDLQHETEVAFISALSIRFVFCFEWIVLFSGGKHAFTSVLLFNLNHAHKVSCDKENEAVLSSISSF